MIRLFAGIVLLASMSWRPAYGQAATAGGPAFEAASVKVADLTVRSSETGGPGTSDPGRIHYGRITIIQLLMTAYGVDLDQVSGPAWIGFMGGNNYDITATMPPGTTKEQFRLMLQALLMERFHLAVHHETKDFPGYELVVAGGGPKMKPAPPEPDEVAPAPTGRASGLQLDKDGFPARRPGSPGSVIFSGGMVRSTNRVDMAEFAKTLGPKDTQINVVAPWSLTPGQNTQVCASDHSRPN